MSKRRCENLVVGSILLLAVGLSGCANGGVSVRELAFAARVALVLSAEEEPTAEEIQSLVDGALEIAEARGVEPEILEYARVLAQIVIVAVESEGDWRAALSDLLVAIEAGENE